MPPRVPNNEQKEEEPSTAWELTELPRSSPSCDASCYFTMPHDPFLNASLPVSLCQTNPKGVSKNRVPQYRIQYAMIMIIMILIMRISKKRAPNFWKQPYSNSKEARNLRDVVKKANKLPPPHTTRCNSNPQGGGLILYYIRSQ